MAKEKHPGAGSYVECDLDGQGTAWTKFGYTENITPPPLERNAVEATNLDETMENTEPGIIAASDFDFLQVWDPGDTDDEQIDAMFGSKVKAQWRVGYPNGVIDTFFGWVRMVSPETIEVDSRIGRTVSVRITSVPVRT